jgi:hypothetical protein
VSEENVTAKRDRKQPEFLSQLSEKASGISKTKRNKNSKVKVGTVFTREHVLDEQEGITNPPDVSTLKQLKEYIKEDGGLWGDERAAGIIAEELGIQILMVDMNQNLATNSNPYYVLASSESPSHAIVLILQK